MRRVKKKCLNNIVLFVINFLKINQKMAIYLKFILVFVTILCISFCEAKTKNSKGILLRQKETNAINFIRIAVMRVVYGIATRLGFGEQISEALNGAFVPPGVDDYDYGGTGDPIFGDDYDY